MVLERATAFLEDIPEDQVYPVIIVVLLIASSVALAMNRDWIGIVGVILLSLISLAYGAIRTPDDMSGD